MTDYIERMIALQSNTDSEVAHSIADDILCEVLIALGYKELVEAYHSVPKWYS